ncbi:MAG: hypothetical protein ACFFDM_01010 [Candidatus Thorarchaeota archaeon]
MSTREQELAKIAKMYTKYLNGPLGSGVMDHLKEGESFTIRSQDETLEIIKIQGKAVVKVIDPSVHTNQSTNHAPHHAH